MGTWRVAHVKPMDVDATGQCKHSCRQECLPGIKAHNFLATCFLHGIGIRLTGPQQCRHFREARVAKPRVGSRVGEHLIG